MNLFLTFPRGDFLPIYSLDDQFNFKSSFVDNPFDAVWNYGGEMKGYILGEGEPSYFDDIILDYSNPDIAFS